MFIKPWSIIKLIFYIIKLRFRLRVGRGEAEHHHQRRCRLNRIFPWLGFLNTSLISSYQLPSSDVPLHGRYNPIAYIAVQYISPPVWIFYSQQLQSKTREAVLLRGNIVFTALVHFNMFGLSDNVQEILRDTGVKTRQRHCLSPQLIWKVFYSRGKENISLLPIHLANSQEVGFPEEEQLVHILGRELVALRLHDHPCCAEQTFYRSWCSRGCEVPLWKWFFIKIRV